MKNINNKNVDVKAEPSLTYTYVSDENLGLEQLLFRLFEQVTNERPESHS